MTSCVPGFQAYPYQEEIVQLALKQNSIICLATGTGKTFISSMVIKEHYTGDGLSYKDNGKRIFFCVNSVPLVTQQAKEIRRHTCLTVGEYRGDMNVDSWTNQKWVEEFNKNDVFVMTGQILCNLLLEAKIKKDHISLLVFDECHNASGDHNYNQILRVFQGRNTPPILGLTASIINEKYKNKRTDKEAITDFLERKMRDLEGRMRSVCITCVDPESVSKYVRKPIECIYSFDSGYSVNGYQEVDELIKTFMQMFTEIEDKCKMSKSNARKKRRSEISFEQIIQIVQSGNYHMSRLIAVEIVLDISRYMKHILESLGPLCCDKAAELMLIELGKKDFPDSASELVEECVNVLKSFQKRYKDVVESYFQTTENVYPVEPFITAKASSFLSDVLYRQKIYYKSTDSELHGIVFTRRRCSAVILSHLINFTVIRDMPTYEGIWSEPILGHSADANLKLADSNMKSKDQDKILERFRKGEFSVLVATSVVEEGLDVRKCNLVVKFDGLFNYREYVQSKGRARSNNSKFILMTCIEEKQEAERTLKVMQIMEEILFEKCHNREMPDDTEVQDALFDSDEEDMPTYFSNNSADSARITKCSTVSLVYRYCNSLSKDEYSNTNPHFFFNKVGYNNHQAICILPMSCPLPKRLYKSELFPSKDKCKRSVCLKICGLLHEIGELNDEFLLPVSHRNVEEKSDDEDTTREDSTNNKDFYSRIIPDSLKYAGVFSQSKHDLYVIDMRLVQPNERAAALWGFWYKDNLKKFGVILPKHLPELPTMKVYTRAGEVDMELRKISTTLVMSDDVISNIMTFHQTVFLENSKEYIIGDIEFDFSSNNVCKALVVPLNDNEDDIDHSYMKFVSTQHVDGCGDMYNRVIRKTYLPNQMNRKYLVESVTNLTPFSLISNGKTYADYYKEKYNVELDFNQYLLDVVPLTERITYSIQTERKKPPSPPREEKLVPQLCEIVSPLTVDCYLQTHCLPFLFYAVECWLSVCALKDLFASKLNMATPSACNEMQDVDMDEEDTLSAVDYLDVMLRCSEKTTPTSYSLSVEQLWECVTSKQALFPFNLERLEMLGDSFLKLATTIHLFYSYRKYDEGRLTKKRTSVVSNENLFRIAKTLKIQHIICNSNFGASNPESENKNPQTVWLPPGFKRKSTNSIVGANVNSLDETLPYQLIQNKCLADTIEAMIGLHLKTSGLNMALKFMSDILKIKVLYKEIYEKQASRDEDFKESAYADYPPISSALREINETSMREVASLYKKGKLSDIEKALKYKFSDKSHLVQAMTHLSYQQNQVTDCYQRYEYLGDAILDFLVTSHVYAKRPTYSPGELTSIRSALVNNNMFSLLAMKFDLYTHLFQQSSSLYADYSKFKSVVDESELDTLFKNPFIIVSKSTGEGLHAPKVLGDMIESLAGAIFLDSRCDLVTVWRVFYPILRPVIEQYLKDVPLNPVRQVMEKYPGVTFSYSDDSLSCSIHIEGKDVVTGFGKNKKIAKASCCARLLRNEDCAVKT